MYTFVIKGVKKWEREYRNAPIFFLDDLWTVEEQVQQAIALGHTAPNLAILLGKQKGSPLVCLDSDGAAGIAQLRALGVASTDSSWIARTPRGNRYCFCYVPDVPLPPRLIRAGKLPLDFLVNGYALIEPSFVTDRENQINGGYHWVPGHSPKDIALASFAPNSLAPS